MLLDQIASQLSAFLANIGFLPRDIFNEWTLIQISILLISTLSSRFIVGYLKDRISDRLRRIEGQRALLRFLVTVQQRLFWFFLAIQLWLGFLILRGITWPSHSYLLRTFASLAITWFIISVASRLIRNKFISRLIALTAWTIVALYITGLLPKTQALLESTGFTLGGSRISLLGIFKSGLLLVVLIWLALFVSQLINNAIAKNDELSPSVQVLLQKILRFTLLAFAVLISLGAVGIDFTALAVFSGALGIGIGLGLQKIVSNFISGIILLLDKSIKPGDVIEIETVSGGTYGWVQNLGARYTSVRTRDGTETLIPNETFIDTPVTNWTHTNQTVRRKLPIGVSYDTDVERAIELSLEAVEGVPRVLKVPSPVCLVKGFGDSSVDLELRFWINDPEGGVANVSSKVYLQVWKLFQANGIEIPFPQRDLNIRSSIPLEVKTKK